MPKRGATRRSPLKQRAIIRVYKPPSREEIDGAGMPWDIMPFGALEDIERLAPNAVTARLVWAIWNWLEREDFTLLNEERVAEDLGCSSDEVMAGMRWLEKIEFVERAKVFVEGGSHAAWKITQKYGLNNEPDTWETGEKDVHILTDKIRGKVVVAGAGARKILSKRAEGRMATSLLATMPALPAMPGSRAFFYPSLNARLVAKRLDTKPQWVRIAMQRLRAIGLLRRNRRLHGKSALVTWRRVPGGLWATSFHLWIAFRIGPSPAHRAR